MRNFTSLPLWFSLSIMAMLTFFVHAKLHAQSEWTYIKEFEYSFDPFGYTDIDEWNIEALHERNNGDVLYRNLYHQNDPYGVCWYKGVTGLLDGSSGELLFESASCETYSLDFETFEGWYKTHDGGRLEIFSKSSDQPGEVLSLTKYDGNGNYQWLKGILMPPWEPVPGFQEWTNFEPFGMLLLPNGGYLIAGTSLGAGQDQVRIDKYGNVMSFDYVGGGSAPYDRLRIFHQTDSSYVYAFDNHFQAINPNDGLLDSLTVSPLKQLKAANDGNLVALGDSSLSKYDLNDFSTIWSYNYPQVAGATFADFAKTPQGNFLITGGYEGNVLLLKADSLGDYLWHQTFDFDTIGGYGNHIIETRDGGALIAGDVGDFEDTRLGFVKKIAGVGDQYHTYITGKVYEDDNENCLPDEDEAALNQTILQLKPEHRFTVANDSGYYSIGVNYGESYQLQAHPAPGYAWNDACPPNGVHAFDMTPATDTVKHFGARDIAFCANELSVNIGTPFHRRCALNRHFIEYCNHTNAIVQNAHVEVQLPGEVFFMESSLPLSDQNGVFYTFDVPDLEPFECGAILHH